MRNITLRGAPAELWRRCRRALKRVLGEPEIEGAVRLTGAAVLTADWPDPRETRDLDAIVTARATGRRLDDALERAAAESGGRLWSHPLEINRVIWFDEDKAATEHIDLITAGGRAVRAAETAMVNGEPEAVSGKAGYRDDARAWEPGTWEQVEGFSRRADALDAFALVTGYEKPETGGV